MGKYTFNLIVIFQQVFTRTMKLITAKNNLISPDFPVRKFRGKAQFPHSFGQIARNYAQLCLSAKFPHQEIR